MKRIVVLSSLVTSAVWMTMTAVTMIFAFPTLVDAQVARITAQGLTVVRQDGLQGMTADVQPNGGGQLLLLGSDGTTQRVRLGTYGAGGSWVGVLDPAGNARVDIATGGENGASPSAEGLNMDDSNGMQLARLGTGAPGTRVVLLLTDQQENPRIQLSVADDGTPSIKMLDATGNVAWSAP